MAYGVTIYSASGVARVYDNSWLLRYYSRYRVTVSANTGKNIYITGFDPSTWAVIIETASAQSGDFYMYLYSGRIRLVAGIRDSTFTFTVYQG